MVAVQWCSVKVLVFYRGRCSDGFMVSSGSITGIFFLREVVGIKGCFVHPGVFDLSFFFFF